MNSIIMGIKNFVKNLSSNNCSHENIKWMDTICMIAGYKKEGICLDCGKQLLKDNDGRVIEK